MHDTIDINQHQDGKFPQKPTEKKDERLSLSSPVRKMKNFRIVNEIWVHYVIPARVQFKFKGEKLKIVICVRRCNLLWQS